jgi:hypothetical protein
MRDNLRQYRAIRAALLQGYPGEPQGLWRRGLPLRVEGGVRCLTNPPDTVGQPPSKF